jgi:hypothetical protein
MRDGFHLPGLDPGDTSGWLTLERDGLEFRFPRLNAGGLARMSTRLRAARERALASRSPGSIAKTLAAAATRLQAESRDGELDAAVSIMSGYSTTMVRHVLDRMACDWDEAALMRLLDAELDGGRALEGFHTQPGRSVRSRAFGPALTLHIFAGNVPGVAVTALIRSLLVRSSVLGKMASGEPVLAAAFARAVAAIDPGLGACMAVTYWPSEDADPTRAAMGRADAIVVYGGANAARSVREQAPVHTRIIEHGPRFSIGVVSRTALDGGAHAEGLAREIALSVATFDQQGCVSPHAIWVEEGGSIRSRDLAEGIARELSVLAVELPAGPRSAGEAASVHDARARAEFRAGSGATEVWAASDTGWTVIHEGSGAFEPSPLSRTIRVLATADLEAVPDLIAGHRALLQTVAIAADTATIAALAQRFAAAGATRITTFERMPWPPMDGHHDGRGPLSELVRWVDLEAG